MTVITVQIPGVPGPVGPPGPAGTPGPPNTLTIGTVGVGDASAAISGTAPNQVLSLTLPVVNLTIGTVTTGGSVAAASFTKTGATQALNLTIPTGPAGRAPVFEATSSTSTTITSSESRTFTIDGTEPFDFVVGQFVRIARSSSSDTYLAGAITAVDKAARTVTILASESSGSGTYTDWVLSVTGRRGATGATGANGPTGPGYTSRGAWASGTAYALRDIVTNDGSTFEVIVAHTAATAPTVAAPTANFRLWAQKGEQGTAGAGAPDATTTSKGSVQLAGDLAGTASAPTVPALANKLNTADAPELIRDTIGTALTAGSNVTITPNDAGDTITIAATDTTDPEIVRDTIGATLVAGSNITIAVNDTANTITIGATGTDPETVRDTIGTALVAGTNMTVVVDDTADTITLNSTTDPEVVRDTIDAALIASAPITKLTDDVGNSITIGVTNASENGPGVVELATAAETTTGTSTALAVHPAGLKVELDKKAPTTRSITAGTGLAGGGDLSADRNLSVSYGSAAGTAVQGNDARVTADQAAATASIRTLGTGALQAKPGNYAPPVATEAVSGTVELATAAETTTGTDNTRAVHPAGLKVELDKKVTGVAITSMERLTQAAYDAITTKDTNRLYVIVG